MSESKIVKGNFAKATPTQEKLANDLYALLNEYAGLVSMAYMVGVLEMVKADVLDSMVK